MPKITFLTTGETYEVSPGTSFLDFCQENDMPHDFGCTVGSCGTCRLVLVEGAGNVQPITEEEADTLFMVTHERGARLGCQLIVNGDIAVRKAADHDGYEA
jgi:adenylate cyclase